jgi:hypothetical protein
MSTNTLISFKGNKPLQNCNEPIIRTAISRMNPQLTSSDPLLHLHHGMSKLQEGKGRPFYRIFLGTCKLAFQTRRNKNHTQSDNIEVTKLVLYLVETLCYTLEGRWLDSRKGHWIFQLTKSFELHYGPGVDSTCNRNEYQESSCA